MNTNKVFMTGNLTKDPEMVTLSTGTKKCYFRIAVNGYGDHTDYFAVGVFGPLAENCMKYIQKATKVALTGRLQTHDVDDGDGKKRYIYEIVADNVEFLSRTKKVEDEEPTERPKNYKQEKMGGLPPIAPMADEDLPW